MPSVLALTDLLLGAVYADGVFCEREQKMVRDVLRRTMRVEELPDEIEQRILTFDPNAFDPRAAAERFVSTMGGGGIGRRRLLEIINEVCNADGRLELDENTYMLTLVVALAMQPHEYKDIVVKGTLQGLWHAVKRGEDLVLGLTALGMAAVPMAAIALGVKATSKGPVFFKQRRYGLHGREIGVLKFRSMTVAEDGAQVTQAKKGDARVTPFGAFLRRSSLDELPQILNVLKGDMSLVGPRPHATAHNELYRNIIGRYMLRHQIKPGITGWAQVNGWRGETDTLEKMVKRVEHDLHYIQSWSLWLDIKIMWLTVFGSKVRDNAY
jgi:putative colanic acid biosynthesis UDP-glucose lipid carrier transferase